MTELSIQNLTKDFGRIRAVEDLTFTVRAGKITGFLGPNGAGKTTTLRMLLGLVQATSGTALIGGRPYDDLAQPRSVVGAVLEATGAHPGRRGGDHLRILSELYGWDSNRVDEALDRVGLLESADRRVSGYSLGMRQRLGLAGALLGDPRVLVLDEPANGLDPEGMAWLRRLMRELAGEGRTILISSHVLSEVAQTVDDVVIINRGSLRFSGSLQELGSANVIVRTSQVDELRDILASHGLKVTAAAGSGLCVHGTTAEEVGRLAADGRVALSALADANSSLESAFLELTNSNAAEIPATVNEGVKS